jgi:hypothetical protein
MLTWGLDPHRHPRLPSSALLLPLCQITCALNTSKYSIEQPAQLLHSCLIWRSMSPACSAHMLLGVQLGVFGLAGTLPVALPAVRRWADGPPQLVQDRAGRGGGARKRCCRQPL